jgi:internalin A
MTKATFRTGVFVSYSRKDKSWLEKLRIALAPSMRGEKLEVWDDSHIQPGAKWADEIRKATARARVGVLLVSPDFLASDYVSSVELPAMLKQQAFGLTV